MARIFIPEPGQMPDVQESLFWTDPQLSVCTKSNGDLRHSSNSIIRAFKDGEADFIVYCTTNVSVHYGMRGYKLLKQYAAYRPRVRELTRRLHTALMNKQLEAELQ